MKLLGNCIHYWVFETPSGPTSKGVCKKCGKKQVAENHMDASPISSFRMKSMKKEKTLKKRALRYDRISEADEEKV